MHAVHVHALFTRMYDVCMVAFYMLIFHVSAKGLQTTCMQGAVIDARDITRMFVSTARSF